MFVEIHGVSHITDGDKTKSTDLDTKHDVTLSEKSVENVSQKQKGNKKSHSRDTSAKIKPHFHGTASITFLNLAKISKSSMLFLCFKCFIITTLKFHFGLYVQYTVKF